jgi:hypothetical protein
VLCSQTIRAITRATSGCDWTSLAGFQDRPADSAALPAVVGECRKRRDGRVHGGRLPARHPFAGLGRDQIPHASILIRVTQQLGGSLGIAVLTLIRQHALATARTTTALAHGFQQAFWWAVAFTAVAVPVCLLPPAKPAPAQTGPGDAPVPGEQAFDSAALPQPAEATGVSTTRHAIGNRWE